MEVVYDKEIFRFAFRVVSFFCLKIAGPVRRWTGLHIGRQFTLGSPAGGR